MAGRRKASALSDLEMLFGCRECARIGGNCGKGHVYLLGLPDDERAYVGSTSKAIPERFEDNFRKTDGKYKYNAPSSVAIRRNGDRVIVYNGEAINWNPVGSTKKKDLQEVEEKLAVHLAKRFPGIVWCDRLPKKYRED